MKISIDHLKHLLEDDIKNEDISSKLMQLGHENEINQNILDIEITPNRGDCLSLRGLARELNYFYGAKIEFKIYEPEIDELVFNFSNEAKEDCPNISFLKVEVDNLPDVYEPYLENYFESLEIKKNNFFTDISNYVSYELGQPTHCYDFSNIGEGLTLTKTSENKEFVTLTGKKLTLDGGELVFLQNDNVINLAGVMGGSTTACSNKTKEVLIECAYFNPESVIGRSIKYDLNSDAAYKFERGIDPSNINYALRRFIKIVEDHATIKKLEIFEDNYSEKKQKLIKNRLQEVNSILGTDITNDKYTKILESLGFKVNEEISVPNHRNDIEGINDIAEEVARYTGYDNLPTKEFKVNKDSASSAKSDDQIRAFLIQNGFNEVINYPFTSKNSNDAIQVDNPLDSNKKFLRQTITDSLIENLALNERRQKDSVKLFEISNLYSGNDSIKEEKFLGLIIAGRKGHNYKEFNSYLDFDYLKSILEKLGIDNSLISNVSRESVNSKSKYEIFTCEVSIDEINTENLMKLSIKENIKFENTKFSGISEYPLIVRDLSFLINDKNQIQILLDSIESIENTILKNRFIFDFFENEKKGYFKVGYRFIFQSSIKTLTDEEVEKVITDIVESSIKIDGVSIPGMQK